MIEEFVECGICGKNHCRYIQLLDATICEKCEREIVHGNCEDIRYELYNILLKKMWKEYLIRM